MPDYTTITLLTDTSLALSAHTGPGRRSSQDISAGVAVLVTEAQFPQYKPPPWVFERLKEWVKLAKTGQVCDKSISRTTVDLRIDALSKRTVESDTAMAEFLKFNAPAQGDCASKAGPALHTSIYLGLDHGAVLMASAPEVLSLFEKGLIAWRAKTLLVLIDEQPWKDTPDSIGATEQSLPFAFDPVSEYFEDPPAAKPQGPRGVSLHRPKV
ncbi:uncharacterized protein LA080_007851 [Diaporthe eres]|nr:uncharacterized protein LA080_007851 [Diaporthe eres]